MNTSISNLTKQKVKDIVLQNSKTVNVFEKYNIDFCCNGDKQLAAAINENKLNEQSILKEIASALNSDEPSTNNFSQYSGNDLIDHIINKHHSYVKSALPLISNHLRKVAGKHGSKYGYVKEMLETFELLAEDMMSHMQKEERILFPLIKYLVESKKLHDKPKTRGYGSVQNPIKQMVLEHDNAGDLIHKLKELSNNFNPPDDACTTFRLMLNELDEFEKDLHQHIHLENNILFPKAIKLEEELINKQ